MQGLPFGLCHFLRHSRTDGEQWLTSPSKLPRHFKRSHHTMQCGFQHFPTYLWIPSQCGKILLRNSWLDAANCAVLQGWEDGKRGVIFHLSRGLRMMALLQQPHVPPVLGTVFTMQHKAPLMLKIWTALLEPYSHGPTCYASLIHSVLSCFPTKLQVALKLVTIIWFLV